MGRIKDEDTETFDLLDDWALIDSRVLACFWLEEPNEMVAGVSGMEGLPESMGVLGTSISVTTSAFGAHFRVVMVTKAGGGGISSDASSSTLGS